uniref:Uncharacterized protein n=1 Tax=Brassica oleracea TaxID=3712 RepID=A0A3P6AVB8_BRAOL|nr:unnamed protein product [Brassica oleracea]
MCCGKRRYTVIKDADDMGTGVFDKSLSCFGCGLGCFLLEFVFPPVWYYATFLYFGKYYRRDPRERAGLAASPITVSYFLYENYGIDSYNTISPEKTHSILKNASFIIRKNPGVARKNPLVYLMIKQFKRKEGAYHEFLDSTDFSLVGGDIDGDGSFRRHLR